MRAIPASPAPDLEGDTLTAAARAIVAEEEALLATVQRALAARLAPARGEGDLVGRLRDLRDEALEATPKDLPTVFQEMGLLRAVMERVRPDQLPDPAAPYFAHLRVHEGGERRDYFLGRHTFVDRPAGVRVVDWRFAPVAGIFYRYREGEEFEEAFPGRVATGTVEARRVVVVERGVLTRIAAGPLTLVREGGRWRALAAEAAALGGGAGSAARAGALGTGAGAAGRAGPADITALLDPDQYEAVAAPADRPLLVLGSAGSGKTTVALHRLARIAFEDPRRFPPARLQVVVPELGLARLAARLLEPLGLERSPVRTLESWSRGAFQSVFGAPPPRLFPETPPLVARLKRHPALYELLRRRPHVARERPALARLRRELGDLFVDRGFLEAVVKAAAGTLPATAVDETLRHTRLQLSSSTEDLLAGVDPERLQTLDGKAVDEDTPEAAAGTLDVEDLPILLFLAALRAGAPARKAAHLVVDEAEDVTLFELHVLGRHLAGTSVTLAGDESQQTFASYAGWPQALAALGAPAAATVRLATTYRCPEPVAALAHAVLGPIAPPERPRAGRRGAPVSRFDFPTEAHAHLFLAGALRELVEREPGASAAVVCSGPEVARSLHRLLADMPEARLSLDGAFTFRPGVDLTDVDGVKGLEFDYVVVPDATARAYPETDEARRRLHVAVTRAAHQLWIAAPGTPSPLLRGLPRG
ncbi:superfamily I DNA and RNA helicase-like protein [Anaeromyxobacter sp. K]|uniref:ATP-binding domain-containing protein n=1 Tax=Anaeromyxobacter sp. (strain K) TaxID=447217 RepID=UPI00017BE299|nr:ATP-binding domain-containing protein [Anaeromyxobacter sp. K]ACG72110.1 superfamily I DNA and RNA helicase-like protein [Anaeromyxobacter sp. K]